TADRRRQTRRAHTLVATPSLRARHDHARRDGDSQRRSTSRAEPTISRAMADAALVLHAETMWASPYGFSSWVALQEKGLPFTVREAPLVDLETRARAYQDRTVTAKVPALEHGPFCVAESSAIAEYLEDVFPPPAHPRLLPADAHDRARARQLMAWFRSD